MVFERAANQFDIIGNQCRSQRIAVKTTELTAIKHEIERAGAVNQTKIGEAGHHTPSAAKRTALISWVRVSRVTSSQARQPPE